MQLHHDTKRFPCSNMSHSTPQLRLLQPICYEGVSEQYRYKLDERDWEDVSLVTATASAKRREELYPHTSSSGRIKGLSTQLVDKSLLHSHQVYCPFRLTFSKNSSPLPLARLRMA